MMLALPLVGACAFLPGRDPLKVNVVGVEALEGQGLELRLAVKLRVQNPNDMPVEYDGVSVDLAVRGNDLASGVSPERGTVPRYGEAVIIVPVTITPMAVLVQAYGLTRADNRKISYALRGKLAGSGFGGVRFESSGEFELPLAAATTPTR
jgi:LEA14-like dessication related protein